MGGIGDRVAMGVAALGLAVAVAAGPILGTPPGASHGPVAAEAFVAAWERKLEGTWFVEATFTRTTSTGGGLTETVRTAQRPPDRLRSGLGATEGRLGGHVVRCATADSCITGAEAQPYEQEVADEMAALVDYVLGDRPLYTTTDFGDGCFRLVLALDFPAPPYGDQALFCFDAASGAPVLTVLDREGTSERTEATTVRSTISDEDFRLPS